MQNIAQRRKKYQEYEEEKRAQEKYIDAEAVQQGDS